MLVKFGSEIAFRVPYNIALRVFGPFCLAGREAVGSAEVQLS